MRAQGVPTAPVRGVASARAEPAGHGAGLRGLGQSGRGQNQKTSGAALAASSPPGLYLNAGWVWDDCGFSAPPSSALPLDATLRSSEYLCCRRRWGGEEAAPCLPNRAASGSQITSPSRTHRFPGRSEIQLASALLQE